MITPRAPYKLKQGQVIEAPDEELWIRSHDDVHKTAADILGDVEALGWIDLACIGAACVNQANKSLAIARERLRSSRRDLVTQQWFSTITDDKNETRTRLMIRVFIIDI